jgi:hypothetical protein
MKVSAIKKMLEVYPDDEHIVIAWWDKTLFATIGDDLKEKPIKTATWIEAVNNIDDGDEVFTDFINSTIHDLITEAIAKVEAEKSK